MNISSSGTPAGAYRPLPGIALMLLGMLCFSFMDGIAKWIVVTVPLLQTLAVRNAMTLVLLAPLIRRGGGWRTLRTARPLAHAVRAALSLGALTCFFEALRHLPLATCVALVFSSPLFMTLSSVVLLKEKVGRHQWAAVAVGFAGVLVIVRPETEGINALAAGLAVLSSLFFALSMTTVRWLARTETDIGMLFYQNLGVMLVGMAALPFIWVPLGWPDLLGLAGMALAATGGQYFMIRAFRLAPVGVVAPFEYTELIWVTLIGYAVWREFPDATVWAGAAIIIAAGLYMIWMETGKRRAA